MQVTTAKPVLAVRILAIIVHSKIKESHTAATGWSDGICSGYIYDFSDKHKPTNNVTKIARTNKNIRFIFPS